MSVPEATKKMGPVAAACLEEAALLRARADRLELAAVYLDESPVTPKIIERTRQLLAEGKIPLMPGAMRDAADEINRLKSEAMMLRGQLKVVVDWIDELAEGGCLEQAQETRRDCLEAINYVHS